MKDIRAVRGALRLRRMVDEGEHTTQDFKFAISDAPKIARSLSAFANRDGGRLLIGVKDNGVIAGVRNEEDIYVVEQAAERYCRPAQHVDFSAYRLEAGINVIVAEIAPAVDKPVFALEASGAPRAYYRVADENIAAHPLMVRSWQMRSEAAMVAFEGAVPAVLAALRRRGIVADSLELALELHISVDTAADALARLAALGLADFDYRGGHFVIIPTPDKP